MAYPSIEDQVKAVRNVCPRLGIVIFVYFLALWARMIFVTINQFSFTNVCFLSILGFATLLLYYWASYANRVELESFRIMRKRIDRDEQS